MHFLRWRVAEPIEYRILIVGIDKADIRWIGTYPIPDRDQVLDDGGNFQENFAFA